MRIPESAIQDVIHRADIVDIARSFHLDLKKAGDNNFKACCPFHNERTPSFHINASKQLYHCFGCGEGGGVIKFVQKMVNTDYIGSIRWLADRYHITLPEFSDGDGPEHTARRKHFDDGMRLLDETAGFFQSNLTGPLGQKAREYLASRGIDDETIQKYRLGYAPDSWDAAVTWATGRGYSPDLLKETGIATFKENHPERLYDRWRNRIMFPICDELSRVVAFTGRIFEAKDEGHGIGKYVNSPESEFFHKGRVLYGYNFARQSFKQAGWALVCEGQLDTIACHRAGLTQAFASQGTAFTTDHARMLTRSGVPSVHLAFDGDTAGFKATMKTIRLLLAANLQVEITTIPQGDDPDSIFRRGGASALQAVMGVWEPALPYAYQVFCRQHPIDTPEGKSAIVHAMLDLYSAIPDEVTAYAHCQELAKQLDLPDRIVTDQYAKRKREDAEAEQRAQEYQRTGQPVIQQPQTAPTMLFHDFHGVCALAATMLDLCVHFEPIAYTWKDLDVGEVMPAETPVVRALNMVLAGTAEDDWQGTIDALSQCELAEDATVAKVFMMSPFAEAVIAEDGTLPDMLMHAVQDCEDRLEKLKLEFQQQRVAEQLNDSTFSNGDELLRQSLELAKRKSAMRRKNA